MAEKAKKTNSNKNAIIGICAAIVVIAIVVVAVVLLTKNKGGLNDSYFTSDGSKYVLTLDANDLITDNDEIKPVKAHIIYFYSGDNITGVKSYYEFADEASAKSALAKYMEGGSDIYKEITTDGKFVVITSKETDYEGLTASDVKQQIDFMESLKNSSSTNEGTEIVETIEDVESPETTDTVETVETVEATTE